MHQHTRSWHLSLHIFFLHRQSDQSFEQGFTDHIHLFRHCPAAFYERGELPFQICILKLLNNLRAEICRVQRNTEERGGSDFCCSYVPSHEARARWMNTTHYFGALNMQRGDMLDIWSRSKVLLICYIGTQLSKCPQQAEFNKQSCAFLVCKTFAEEVKSPNQCTTFLLHCNLPWGQHSL